MSIYYSDLNVFKKEELTLLKNGSSIFLEIEIEQISDEEVISLAQVVNNIDFEIYACVCYLEFLEVETNGKFNSEERASKISEITSQLETLNETKTQVNEVAL